MELTKKKTIKKQKIILTTLQNGLTYWVAGKQEWAKWTTDITSKVFFTSLSASNS